MRHLSVSKPTPPTKMNKNKLYTTTIEGEDTPTRRRRIANAITMLLHKDDLLREEVAIQLSLEPSELDYLNAPERERKREFKEC